MSKCDKCRNQAIHFIHVRRRINNGEVQMCFLALCDMHYKDFGECAAGMEVDVNHISESEYLIKSVMGS